jgi:hypothetical protein
VSGYRQRRRNPRGVGPGSPGDAGRNLHEGQLQASQNFHQEFVVGFCEIPACFLTQHVEHIDHSTQALLDAKTRLQHYAQEHLAATPVYRESSRGTPQQPAFASRVSVKGKTLGKGSGPSKKAAQQLIASMA